MGKEWLNNGYDLVIHSSVCLCHLGSSKVELLNHPNQSGIFPKKKILCVFQLLPYDLVCRQQDPGYTKRNGGEWTLLFTPPAEVLKFRINANKSSQVAVEMGDPET
jgi:hypothetical protein